MPLNLCNVTGVLKDSEGNLQASRAIAFVRSGTVAAQGTSTEKVAEVPDPFTVTTDGSGNVDFDAHPGSYAGTVVRANAPDLTFKMVVPDATSADIADIIDSVSEMTPTLLQEAIDARDAAAVSAAMAAAAATEAASYTVRRVAELTSGFNLIAHRGFADIHPQNTLLAFSRALEVTKHIECDVAISSDGTAYLFHDATIDALTDGTGTFTELTDAYIDARTFDELSGTALENLVRVCRFSDMLDLASSNKAIIWPELKGLRSDGDISLIVDMVNEYSMLRRCVFQSGTMSRVTTILNYHSEAQAGFLTESSTLSTLQGYVDTLAEYPFRGWLLMAYSGALAAPEIVEYANARAVGLAVWTVDSEAVLDSLIAIGVQNIMSDYTIGGRKNGI